MSQRVRTRYSKVQSEVVEAESKKIVEACKGYNIPSKNISEWYYPSKNSHRNLVPDPEDDYLLPIFFWRPEKFYHHYVQKIPCINETCNGETKSKGWADGGA